LKEGDWKAFLITLLEEEKREEKGRRSIFVEQPEWPHDDFTPLHSVRNASSNKS
jgi:hypothetical protein